MYLEQNPFRRTYKIAFVMLMLCLPNAMFGQASRSTLTEQAALVTEFDVNGLKVILKRRPGSATVAAGIFFRGGARNLTERNAGIEELMLSSAVEGSVKYPRTALRRELARTGADIGSGSNIDFSALSLASTREDFDNTWRMFTDIAINPAFAPSDVNLIRERILTGLRGREDDPDAHLQSMVDKAILAGTPYQHDTSGTVESISQITIPEIRAYHKKMLQTSRMMIVIVGDLEPTQIKQMVTAAFGKTPRGTYKELPVSPLDFSKPTLDITQRPLPTNYVNGIFAAPSLSSPDYTAMRVAINVLRERVFEEVRVNRNLSYAPSADLGNSASNTGSIYVTAVDANQAISVMLAEIEALKNKPLDEGTMSAIAGQFLTTYFTGQETNAAQAAELARYELIGGGWRNAFAFLDRVQQVTADDVQGVAKKYMTNLRFIVVGDPSKIDRKIFVPES